jgi:hypothetical protein
MNVAEQLKSTVVDALHPILKPLVVKIVESILFPILEEKAKATSTPIDDMVLASVKVSVLESINKAEF